MNHKGFTLIELLVAFCIIAVLFAVVIASLSKSQAKARDARRKTDMAILKVALESYYADHNSYPPSLVGGQPLEDQITGEVYLKTVPTDPKDSAVNYCYNSTDGHSYTLGANFESETNNCAALATPTPAATSSLVPTSQPTPTAPPPGPPAPSPEVTGMSVPVLALKYIPVDQSNPTLVDRNIAGTDLPPGTTVEFVRQKTDTLNSDVSAFLNDASAYHKYKDPASAPVLNYSIYEVKEYLEPVPIVPGSGSRPADHVTILKNKGFDICDYVESQGVKEVWVWMFHSNYAYPVESYQRGPYGGLGNGYMDLPLCAKTYTVYDYNYGRGIGEAVENHDHHIEALMRSINYGVWQNNFVGAEAPASSYRCGWSHCPPNVMSVCPSHNYDWANETSVSSDCEDWKLDGTGVLTTVSCHTWAGATCGNDSGDKFKKWWMQNIPPLWWQFIGEFDAAKSGGANLN